MPGKPRTGSIYRRGYDGRWVASFRVDGGRRQFYGHSEAEVRAKAAAADFTIETRREPPLRIRGSIRLRIAQAVLARARDKGWDDDFTAKVLVASFTPSRANRAIVGPCVYCGDELAGTIDHVRPFARGGKDVPENVVSACAECNFRKGKMAHRKFTSARPDDKRRTCGCGHRSRLHRSLGRCEEMVWSAESDSMVLCSCRKWEPSPVQYPALTG